MLNPEQAADLVSRVAGATPIFSERGPSKGQHVQKAYRFIVPGRHIRHISIARERTEAGTTVYVNGHSVLAAPFPGPISGVTISQFYPKGYVGSTGDKGLSAAAGTLPSLLPADNDVYRLSVHTESGFRALLDWYCGGGAPSSAMGGSLSTSVVAGATRDLGSTARTSVTTTPPLGALVAAFITAFTGDIVKRTIAGGRGIRSGADWFATIYVGGNAVGNAIEVAIEPAKLAHVLGGCPVRHIEHWITRQQNGVGTIAIGHRPTDPWPCIGFTEVAAFDAMLDDWREFKKSWRLHGKPHFTLPLPASAVPMEQDAVDTDNANADVEADGGTPDPEHHDDPVEGDDELVMRAIRSRRGQPEFRRALLAAYQGRCAFSGCAVPDVLEAAHIHLHADGGDYATSNGLLLRADLHTLFDLHLIAVDESLCIRVAPRLHDTDYAQWEGQPIRLPATHADAPNRHALAMRMNVFRQRNASDPLS